MVDTVFNEEGEWRKAHNDYAQTFAELGIIGLFLLGWLLFALIRTSTTVLNRETKGELRYLLMGVIVALGGLSITAFFSFPFQLATPTFVFALYLGVLGGCSSQPIQPENPVRQGKTSITLTRWAVQVSIACIFLSLLILLPFQYNRLMADGFLQKSRCTCFPTGLGCSYSSSQGGLWAQSIPEGVPLSDGQSAFADRECGCRDRNDRRISGGLPLLRQCSSQYGCGLC